ncbi:hypothetical protein NDN08_007479 [Rhodosorus marinus]|uniref:DUF1995 domain-containing protein n=1 Tax=Rhodosorus marinus TaxID=101924 RepID=A0AAV8UXP4_9RHOD|nr:hypothetical protein NDN08_007479 [Rhodosorus marinus]
MAFVGVCSSVSVRRSSGGRVDRRRRCVLKAASPVSEGNAQAVSEGNAQVVSEENTQGDVEELPVEVAAEGIQDVTVELVGDSPFTRNLNVSPMPRSERQHYINEVTNAIAARVDDVLSGKVENNLISVTMLLPELNTSLDIYDRRFLLSLAWEIVIEMVKARGLTVKVMTQCPTKFGGLPLSVAGLRRHFEGDRELSRESWGEAMDRVRTGDIDAVAVAEDDDVFLVLAPTNIVSAPVIEDCIGLAKKVDGKRPIITLNARLDEVPSHSGVMQVQGRKERLDFVKSFYVASYLRCLYPIGRNFPLVGALRRHYPGKWEVWLHKQTEKDGDEDFRLIGEFDDMPTSGQIGDAIKVERFRSSPAPEGLPASFSLGIMAAMVVLFWLINR